ncbi:MAG: hypothetical protein ACRC7O_18355 [Fimbriiglobus sp.]
MSTATRMDRARDNAAVTRTENGPRKRAARAHRDATYAGLIKTGTFPYTPAVMSWVSVKLGKRAALVTEAEAKSLAK